MKNRMILGGIIILMWGIVGGFDWVFEGINILDSISIQNPVQDFVLNNQQANLDLEIAKVKVWNDFVKLNPGVNYHPVILENKQELINTLLSLKNIDVLDEEAANKLFNIMNTKFSAYNFSLN